MIRCDRYRIHPDGVARRCRRRARVRVAIGRGYVVCRECLTAVVALQGRPVAWEELERVAR